MKQTGTWNSRYPFKPVKGIFLLAGSYRCATKFSDLGLALTDNQHFSFQYQSHKLYSIARQKRKLFL